MGVEAEGMSSRPLCVAAMVLSLGLVAPAHAAPTPCHFLTSDRVGTWPSGIVGPGGATLSGNLDITALDLSSDLRQISVKISLRELSQKDPLTTVGAHYDVRGDLGQKRLHFDAMVQVNATHFFSFVEDLDETTGQPATVQTPGGSSRPASGVLDVKASTITLTAPLSNFDFHTAPQRGQRIKNWVVSAYRMADTMETGGPDLPGDHDGTTRLYKLGESPCGRFEAR